MRPEDEWDIVRGSRGSILGGAGMGALRVALLFGSAGVALALIIAPIAENYTRPHFDGAGYGVDLMSTGSIAPKPGFTIRRSVLQATPNAVCIIRNDGSRSGDC
jgi:hypothetical protein